MRVIVIGGTGTVGSAVVKELAPRHEIVVVGHKQGDILCDITSEESIRNMFQKAGKFHAVVITTGHVHFEDLSKMTAEKYQLGLQDKLMGQVNVVLIGMKAIENKGSFTLTSGILSEDPIPTGSSAAMVNGAIDSFVQAAAIELPHGIRINAVSPTVLVESMGAYAAYFRGYNPVAAKTVALAFSKSVEGLQTGKVYRVGY